MEGVIVHNDDKENEERKPISVQEATQEKGGCDRTEANTFASATEVASCEEEREVSRL